MTALKFGTSSYTRPLGGLPDLPVINMIAEAAPTEAGGIMLQSRYGLADRSETMSTGPIKALFRLDGVFSGDLFGVSGSHFYHGTTDLGAMTGPGPYSIAAFSDRIYVATGLNLYGWDGTTFATVGSDAAAVGKVIIGGGRVVIIDTAFDTFYWSQPYNGTINALSFAQAESSPDRLRDMLFLDDILVLFGAKTVEFWPNTGDDDLPFVPLESRVFERGIRATGCAATFDAKIAWVTEINQVCVNDPEGVISSPGMQADIAASTGCRLWSFDMGGTEYLALTLDNGTWVYSAASHLWSEFQSYGKANWWGQCFSDGVFGSAYDGKTLEFDEAFTELTGRLERRFRAGSQLDGGMSYIGNLSLRSNPGHTEFLSGSYVNPTVSMRFSDDGGQTWTSWNDDTTLGTQGQYGKAVGWEALGMFGQPGFLAEFRCTDPVDWRVSGVAINEGFSGL